MARRFLMKSWRKANRTAKKMVKQLKTSESQSRCFADRIDGGKRHGWRVTCQRLSDGKKLSKFVSDKAK